MQTLVSLIAILYLTSSCQSSGTAPRANVDTATIKPTKDTVPAATPLKPYEDITYDKKEVLTAAGGTKSVIFNASGTKH